VADTVDRVTDDVSHGATEFAIDVRAATDDPVVVVRGVIDFETSNRVRETLASLARDDRRGVTLDIGGVTFVDSVGLSVLVQAKKRFAAAGQELRFANVAPTVRRTVEIAGAVEFLGIP